MKGTRREIQPGTSCDNRREKLKKRVMASPKRADKRKEERKMGMYTVWAVTGAQPDAAAILQAKELVEVYDECQNCIPGGWRGLSFDYYEPEHAVINAPEALRRLENGDPPAALITPEGQITSLDNDWNAPAEEYVNLVAGPSWREAMKQALLEAPGQAVIVMRWHS